MSSLRTCQQCGGDLRAGSLEGLCPRCLAHLAFPPGGESDGRPGNFPSFAFGDYELIEEIARGGMGVVYKANQKKLNRLVALKMILNGPFSSAEFVRRFKIEAETIARLKHPNIVTIYEVGERDGPHYLAMELINGRSLAEVVRDNPLEPRRAAIYLQTIARATHYAHECGVVHRDLKPSNLLLDLLDQPHVTDFGLAKLVNASGDITVTNQALGSPGYMAPENVSGRKPGLEKLGDIYSLGAVLYHLLTGRAPFQGEALQEVLMQVQNDDPLPIRRLNPGVPVALETICLKCLNKEPHKRYASAGELADDLGRFLANEPIVAKPVTWLERMILWARRRPIQTALSLALAGTFVAGVLGVFLEWRKAERNALGEAQERQTASRYAETMRVNLYAADVNLAARALEQSDLGRAREVLEGLRPKAGEADIRGFEWRYLHQRCQGDELATLGGHEWIVTCAAFSPDGHQLLTGSQDGTAKLWDVEHKSLLHTFAGSTSSVWTVDFLPDASKLLISGLGRQVELWDAKTFSKKLRHSRSDYGFGASSTLVGDGGFEPVLLGTLRGGGAMELSNRREAPGICEPGTRGGYLGGRPVDGIRKGWQGRGFVGAGDGTTHQNNFDGGTRVGSFIQSFGQRVAHFWMGDGNFHLEPGERRTTQKNQRPSGECMGGKFFHGWQRDRDREFGPDHPNLGCRHVEAVAGFARP